MKIICYLFHIAEASVSKSKVFFFKLYQIQVRSIVNPGQDRDPRSVLNANSNSITDTFNHYRRIYQVLV